MKNESGEPKGPSIRDKNRQLVLELLEQFNREVADEDAARALLYKFAEESGLTRCPSCPAAEIEKINDRTIKCRRCFKTVWITAGTLFHGVRRVRPYLAALYCRANGAVFGAPWFARLIGIADSLGATIAKKIALVINSHVPDDAPAAPSNVFVELICKRSRETPRRKHPRAELDSMSDLFTSDAVESTDVRGGVVDVAELDSGTLSTLSESELTVFNSLSDQSVSFDYLCEVTGMSAGELSAVITILELNGLIKVEVGEKFRLPLSKVQSLSTSINSFASFDWLDKDDGRVDNSAENHINKAGSLLADILQATKDVSGGVSRKCLQLYADLFWCYFDRIRWDYDGLLKACLRHPPIRNGDIVDYVSPPYIKLLPIA